eukprot:sb/3474756/
MFIMFSIIYIRYLHASLSRVDNSHSTSINLNPKLDGFLQDDLRPGSRTKNRVKSADSGRMEEQVIRDSDRVDAKGGTGPRVQYGATDDATTDRPRSRQFSRSQSTGQTSGLTLGQILLVIVCPCRLCFGTRRPN